VRARQDQLIVIGLIALAIVLRALLVAYSPVPFGYVWDYYHDGVRVIYHEGRLPLPSDCWQCAHPPLFFLLGVPFYAFGLLVSGGSIDAGIRWIGALSMLAAGVTVYYGYQLLALYQVRRAERIIGFAILLMSPCLFISSYGADSDILLAAILSAFAYYLARYFAQPESAAMRDAVRLGILAGFAASTKASGLVAVISMVVVFAAALPATRPRRVLLRHVTTALLVAATLGSWKYVDNWRRYGAPFHLSGTANEGFSNANRSNWRDRYSFTSLPFGALERAIGPHLQTGTTLTNLEVYRSVPLTLHAQAWSDMSFFSVPSRHGSTHQPYPWKAIPAPLTWSVILLGFVPGMLMMTGFITTIARRDLLPLAVFGVISIASYIWWILPQPSWALKTKYLLFLLPQYVLYAAFGLRWLTTTLPWLRIPVWALLVALVGAGNLWLLAFALGHL